MPQRSKKAEAARQREGKKKKDAGLPPLVEPEDDAYEPCGTGYDTDDSRVPGVLFGDDDEDGMSLFGSDDEDGELEELEAMYPIFSRKAWKKSSKRKAEEPADEPPAKKKRGPYTGNSRQTIASRRKGNTLLTSFFGTAPSNSEPTEGMDEVPDVIMIDVEQFEGDGTKEHPLEIDVDVEADGADDAQEEAGPSVASALVLLEAEFSELRITAPDDCPDLVARFQRLRGKTPLATQDHTSPAAPSRGDTEKTFNQSSPQPDDDSPSSFSVLDGALRRLLSSTKKAKKASVLDVLDIQLLTDYNILREGLRKEGVSSPDIEASLQIARCKKIRGENKDGVPRGPWFARKIRSMARHVIRTGELPPRKQGKGAKHHSHFDDLRLRRAIEVHLKSLGVGTITPLKFMKELNTTILPSVDIATTISESTAVRWLHKLGFRRAEHRKGVYMDGHERIDVIEYRRVYLGVMAEYQKYMAEYDNVTGERIPPNLPEGVKEHMLVTQDETCVHSNDKQTTSWLREGEQELRQKSRGRLVHVSDFILEATGRLFLTEAELQAQALLPPGQRLKVTDARKIIYPGKNADPYWDAKQLIQQTQDMLDIFDYKFPNAVAVCQFDCSTAHGSFAEDALNVKNMNVNPGGAQRKMHDTIIPDDNADPSKRGQVQSMVFGADHPTFPNQAKGMRQVLEERGLLDIMGAKNGGKNVVGKCAACKLSSQKRDQAEREARARLEADPEFYGSLENANFQDQDDSDIREWCCLERVLSRQTDFKNEKPLLQLMIEKREMLWGYAKRKFREACDGTFPTAKKLVPECLDSCSAEIIRHFFRKTWRYMDAYRKGLTGKQAEYAVKKYKSHRRVGAQVMLDVNVLNN